MTNLLFSVEELAAALTELRTVAVYNPLVGGITTGQLSNPHGLAGEIAKKIMEEREPEYEPGCVYRAVNGFFYFRTSDREWLGFDGHTYSHDFPPRPLARMVPEPKVWTAAEPKPTAEEPNVVRSDN